MKGKQIIVEFHPRGIDFQEVVLRCKCGGDLQKNIGGDHMTSFVCNRCGGHYVLYLNHDKGVSPKYEE